MRDRDLARVRGMLLCLPSVPAAGPAEVRMGWPRDGHSQKRAEPRVWPHPCPQEPRICTQGSLRCRGLHWEGDRRLEEEEESAGGLCMAVLLGRWLNGPSPKAKVWKSSRHQLPTPFGQDPGHWGGSTSVQEPILASGLPPHMGHTGREQVVWAGGHSPAAINSPGADVPATPIPQHPFPPSCKPQHPPAPYTGPAGAGTMTQIHCAPKCGGKTAGKLGDPGAGDRSLCPLLCPSVRHRHPEPPPAWPHPSHRPLSLPNHSGAEGTLVSSEPQHFAINQAFFPQVGGSP